jgi:hypothetical protein
MSNCVKNLLAIVIALAVGLPIAYGVLWYTRTAPHISIEEQGEFWGKVDSAVKIGNLCKLTNPFISTKAPCDAFDSMSREINCYLDDPLFVRAIEPLSIDSDWKLLDEFKVLEIELNQKDQ